MAPLKLHSVQSSRLDRIGYSTRPKRGPIEAAFLLAAFLAGLEYSTRPKRGPIEAKNPLLLFGMNAIVYSTRPKRGPIEALTGGNVPPVCSGIPRVLSVAPLKLPERFA